MIKLTKQINQSVPTFTPAAAPTTNLAAARTDNSAAARADNPVAAARTGDEALQHPVCYLAAESVSGVGVISFVENNFGEHDGDGERVEIFEHGVVGKTDANVDVVGKYSSCSPHSFASKLENSISYLCF